MPRVSIIMGSKNDLPVADKAIAVLKDFSITYDINVASAHRTPKRVLDLVNESDADVFIAIAGMSAALPGVIASFTTKPVIGVPVSGKLNIDSLLSIVQMPSGIPVAAVGLDRGDNAALLAAEILALSDEDISLALTRFRQAQADKVLQDSDEVSEDV